MCGANAEYLYGNANTLLSTRQRTNRAFCSAHFPINSVSVYDYSRGCCASECKRAAVVEGHYQTYFCSYHIMKFMVTRDFRTRDICPNCRNVESQIYENDKRQLVYTVCKFCESDKPNQIKSPFGFGYDRLGAYINTGEMPELTGPEYDKFTEKLVEDATKSKLIRVGTDSRVRYFDTDDIAKILSAVPHYNSRISETFIKSEKRKRDDSANDQNSQAAKKQKMATIENQRQIEEANRNREITAFIDSLLERQAGL